MLITLGSEVAKWVAAGWNRPNTRKATGRALFVKKVLFVRVDGIAGASCVVIHGDPVSPFPIGRVGLNGPQGNRLHESGVSQLKTFRSPRIGEGRVRGQCEDMRGETRALGCSGLACAPIYLTHDSFKGASKRHFRVGRVFWSHRRAPSCK